MKKGSKELALLLEDLCRKSKKLCCICDEPVKKYEWVQYRHPHFKTKSFRVHVGDCRKALMGDL